MNEPAAMGVRTLTRKGMPFEVVRDMSKGAFLRMCEDMERFAGPGNKFEPLPTKGIRWAQWPGQTPGVLAAKEIRFLPHKKGPRDYVLFPRVGLVICLGILVFTDYAYRSSPTRGSCGGRTSRWPWRRASTTRSSPRMAQRRAGGGTRWRWSGRPWSCTAWLPARPSTCAPCGTRSGRRGMAEFVQ